MAPRTVESVKSMKVQELKEELKSLGLPASGVKADLVKRLEETLSSQANGEEEGAPAVEDAKDTETTVTVEVEGDVPPAVVEAAAEAAAEAAEEVVKEETNTEADAEEGVNDEPAAAKAPASADAAVAEVEANGDAAETEETQAMDTAEDGTPAVEEEEEGKENENADTPMEEAPAAAEGTASAGHRLFVGCVPPQFSEDDLKTHFEEVGPVKDVSIMRDQSTGTSKGCAFVVYDTLALAEAAIAKLDKKVKLPGATANVEVRFARETNKVQPVVEPNDKNMLFFARAPPKATEEDIKTAFAEHGEVKSVKVFHNTKATGGLSKGCGFVYFETREGATAAIASMNEKVTLKGGFSPLTVKWADPDLTEKKRKAAEVSEPRNSNANNTQIFYARIPRTTDEEALKEVFAQAGKVKELVLFKINKEANTSKGCGIVTYENHEDAANALATLNETHTFPPMDKTMVLKWVDHDLQEQKKRRIGAGGFMGSPGLGGMGQQPMVEEERPPQGCAPDAFKLYMVGVPKSWDVPELKEALAPYGTVVEANIVRNRETKEPRGVAFAWMKTRAQGERAIKEITKQGEGHQDPMKVTRAKPRGRMGMASGPGPGFGFGSPMSMGPRGGGPSSFGVRPGGFQPRMQAGYTSVRSPASYGPRPASSYGPRAQGGFSRPQGSYNARPQYQQAAPYYPPQSSGPSSYNYARPQPQQQQQASGYNYQQTSYQQPSAYQQPAPAYQAAPAGYQAPAAQGYQAPVSSGYQQPYNPPTQQGYRPAADPQAAAGYGSAQVYEPQPQASYGAPQQAAYGAPAQQGYGAQDTPTQGYNYQQPATAGGQADYGAAPSAAAAAGQYGAQPSVGQYGQAAYAADGYNYGAGRS